MAPTPTPHFILRHHLAQINALTFSPSNHLLYSGDADGIVAVTDTKSRRALAVWKAHEDGVLGVEEWPGVGFLTQGRDNKLHVFAFPSALPTLGHATTSSAASTSTPKLLYSLDVNALNYCRFSLLPLPSKGGEEEAWLAMPNLTDSETIDIFHLPSQTRPHAAVGFVASPSSSSASSSLGRGALDPNKTGLVMSIHLLSPTRLVVGFESGHVALYDYEGPPNGTTDSRIPHPTGKERGRWLTRWKLKVHNEAVMGLAVSPKHDFALSVSADHQVVKYDLSYFSTFSAPPTPEVFKIKQLGNACISINYSGRVCAVGGWDGSVRLFSTKSFKPLGTLPYHRDTCHVLAFANSPAPPTSSSSPTEREEEEESDDDEEDEAGLVRGRDRWLATGGTDARVAVWELIDFESKSKGS
ncbi:WD40-repeat-containing domain protein [Mrakia frigida]|uniref:WD40 repeat domain-containing protein n=1 Tax=Mrakia frigida TaxID=29902 RepID=UPI003FCC23F3